MTSLVDSLMEQLQSRGAMDQIAGKLGVPPDKASSAATTAIPAILAGLARNAKDPQGAASLASALDKDHDGSVLDDDHYFDAYEERQGEKILGHVFGGQTPAVQSQVSSLGGLDNMQGGELLKMLAPLVMGYLGRQKSGGGLDIGDLMGMLGGGSGGGGGLQLPGGLGDLLGGLAGGSTTASTSAKAAPRQSGLGGLLGKFFQKKR